ncbi:MAG: glutathione S-transferase family protein [Sandaracinaceae bacterium]
MNLVLYHSAYSTCSQKVRLTLAEKSLRYTSRELSFRKKEHLRPAYLAINPSGVVPTLMHENAVITDSSVIVEYLEECFPEPALLPDSAVGRARARTWMRFMEEVPTQAIRVPSFERVFLPSLRLISGRRSFDQETGQRSLRRGFYQKMNRGDGFDRRELDESRRLLQMTTDRLEAALAEGPWVLGTQLTLVDLTLAPLMDRMLDLGLTEHFANAPRTAAWMQRLQARPSYETALYRGSRLSDRLEFKFARVGSWLQSRLPGAPTSKPETSTCD